MLAPLSLPLHKPIFKHMPACVSPPHPLQDVDLFSKDFVFVPVHEALHWSLMVVCHPGARLRAAAAAAALLAWRACRPCGCASHNRPPPALPAAAQAI